MLKLNTPNLAAPSLFPNSNPRGPSEIRFSDRWGQRKVELSLSHSLALLDHQSCRSRRDQIRCGMAGGGGGDHNVLETAVWWDLNTCSVPAGVDPRCVRPCIESALEKQIGRRTAVSIYAFGNLEYMSSDLLENISSSGIVLTHSLCGVHELNELLDHWSEDEREKPHPPGYIMMISGDYNMLYPQRFRRYGFTTFVAYPKDVLLAVPLDHLKVLGEEFAKVFAKEFVWETLLNVNLGEKTLSLRDEKPLCICNICDGVYQACDEFITHLKSEEHRNQSFEIVADRYGKPKYFCQVCNYPADDIYNLFLHNESEEHNRKLVEKQAQQEEDCESRTTYPELDLFY